MNIIGNQNQYIKLHLIEKKELWVSDVVVATPPLN